MRNYKFILLIPLFNALRMQAQVRFDTLPGIHHFDQAVDIMDQIRCAAYLFARNFIVRDSLGNIYLSLYYDRDSHETTPEQIKTTSLSIFDVAYNYALEPDIEYIKDFYQNFIVSAYDKNGKLIHYKAYHIQKYKHHRTPAYLTKLLERIRIPNTWIIKDNEYRIVYYCIDNSEQMVFCKPLLLILLNLKLLNEKCDFWKEFYPACRDLEFAESATIKLRK